MKKTTIQNIKSFILVLALVLGVGYAYANFTAPLHTPPNCNTGEPGCDAPVNLTAIAQAKAGPLTIGGTTVPISIYKLNVPGVAFFNNVVTQALTITTNAGAGKFLQSNEDGVATWQTPTTPGEPVPDEKSLTQNGFDVFPSGLILQWGTFTTASTYNNKTHDNKSFPKSFPHQAFSIVVTAGEKGNGSGDKQSQWGGKIVNKDEFSYYAQYENAGAGPFILYWMATGF